MGNFRLKGMKIVKNVKCFVLGMVSGMVVLKSIEMTLENNNTSCKKIAKDLENGVKNKMNCLNSKIQKFDFEKWKSKTVNQLKSWLDDVENLTEDMLKDKTKVKDLFKKVDEDDFCDCDCEN